MLANRSPAVIDADDAEQRPARSPGRGCDPRGPVQESTGARRIRGRPARAGDVGIGRRRRHRLPRIVLLAHAAVPPMTRSSTWFSSMLVGRPVVHHPPVGHHQHPVGQPEDLLDLTGHHHHGDARSRRAS